DGAKSIEKYENDKDGEETRRVLKAALAIVERLTGNSPGSLGLHPAVYFYNERGKYSRFLFLGMASLMAEKLRNNDDGSFKKFTHSRKNVEKFLMDNKSLIGILLQNMGKGNRVSKMRDLFAFLIDESGARLVTPEDAIAHLGLRGRIIDVNAAQIGPTRFSDD